jgi:lactoylglutathione lyase
MKLTHLRLLVNNFDECFRFYRDVMGLQVSWGAEGDGYADFVVNDQFALALFDCREMARAIGSDHLPNESPSMDRAMLIFGTDDLSATVTQMRERGGKFISDIQDHPEWGIRTAYLRDPSGTLIELNSPIPKSEWTAELRAEGDRQEERSRKADG